MCIFHEGQRQKERRLTREEKCPLQFESEDEETARRGPQRSSLIRRPNPKYVDGAFAGVVPHWDQRMVRVVVSKVLQTLMETWHDDAGSHAEGEY